jgi:hypothetical protein
MIALTPPMPRARVASQHHGGEPGVAAEEPRAVSQIL